MRTRTVLAAVALLCATAPAMTGCGDDGDDQPPGGFPNGPGRFDSPADFDRTACQPGVFAGDTPAGIYHFTVDYGDGGESGAAARLDVLGDGSFGGVIARADADLAWADDDVRFLFRRVGDLPTDTASRSLLLCSTDGDALVGQYAFCNNTECFLGSVRARRIERLAEADASGLTLLGELSNPSWGDGVGLNVRVDGDVAYLVRGRDGLRIIDIADPAAPAELAHIPTTPTGEVGDPNEIYNDVKLVSDPGGRRFALLASSRRGIVPVDVSDPARPVRGASFGTVGEDYPSVHTLAVENGRAYLADLELGLDIWNVVDPLAPQHLGTFRPPGAPDSAFLHDLYVEGDRAYLNFWNGGMVIADISDPAAVTAVGAFAGYGDASSHSSWVGTIGNRRIAAHGDEEWGSHLRLVDVTEGTASFAQQVGAWQTREEVSAHNVMVFGTEVWMSYYQDGIRIVDIADPAAPRLTAWFNTWPGYGSEAYGYSFFDGACGIDVDLVRNRVYVADTVRDLIILQR